MARPDDLNPERLIPHRPPWLLIDRVVGLEPGRVRARKQLSADDPLVADGLPEMLMMEALAQTAACLVGGKLGAHRGLLVAAHGLEFSGRPRAGDSLELEAVQIAALGSLHRFQVHAHVAERSL